MGITEFADRVSRTTEVMTALYAALDGPAVEDLEQAVERSLRVRKGITAAMELLAELDGDLRCAELAEVFETLAGVPVSTVATWRTAVDRLHEIWHAGRLIGQMIQPIPEA